ncbi:MAG: hypothetical protein RML34_03160 [Leptospiraceae bacterium]|nr:hypothetical protein [Leptospiraceae bacterium]
MRAIGILLSVLFGAAIWADSLDIKIGAAGLRQKVKVSDFTTYEEKTEWKTGFDGALSYNLMVDKLLAVAPELGLARFSHSGSAPMQGYEIKYEIVTYLIPILINARLFLPMGELGMGEKPPFQPYVTVGIGYTVGEVQRETTQTSTIPGSSGTTTTKQKYGLNGLSYQAVVGTSITLDPTSAVEVLLEGGYRGANLKPDIQGEKAADYPGWLARIGIRYSFGLASSY